MGGMEFNKVFAAILVAGIIAMFAGFIAEQLTAPDFLEEDAYPIEGVEIVAGGAKVEKLAEPVLALLASADVARGQKISKACAACHSFDQGGPNGVGPNLHNIVGATKQNKTGFKYSGALTETGGNVWTMAELNKFLWKPKKYSPGTKMNYVGIRKPDDRAAMIAWLNTLGSNKPMPSATEIAAEEAELALPEPEAADVKEAVQTIKDVAEDADTKTPDSVVKSTNGMPIKSTGPIVDGGEAKIEEYVEEAKNAKKELLD